VKRALRTPVGMLAAAILVTLLVLVVAAPGIWGEAAERIDVNAARHGMSAVHPLGTDDLGRDILARVLVAARYSLMLAVIAAVIGGVAGVAMGALTVVLGRRAGRLVSELISVLLAFPGLLFALFVATVVGVGATGAVAAIGVAFAPGFARLTQTLGASVANADYVAAARQLGVRRTRLLARHVLPNVAEPLILNLTVAVGYALIGLSGLSFLGLGVQPPSYDWGRMLGDGVARIYVTPAAALAPGVAIVLAGLAFTLLGEVAAHAAGAPSSGARPRPAREAGPAEELGQGAKPVVLSVRSLTVRFPGTTPVREVNLDVAPAEIVGIVGESGSGKSDSGKSLTALAMAQLVPHPGVVTAGRLEFHGQDLTSIAPRRQRRLLGTSLAMVFQDPMSSLNPALRVGTQLTEAVEVHLGLRRAAARRVAVDRLRRVRMAWPDQRIHQYPHELSGGMRQRVMLAMGLMGDPDLIIADEPTTALDVTVQRRVLDLIRAVTDEFRTAVILISHDVAVVAGLCHRVLVMYAGRVVEELDVATLTTAPAHPYTRALIASIPDLDSEREQPLATIPGRPPDPAGVPAGCPFAPRCAYATTRCGEQRPELDELKPGQRVACWHPQSEPVRNGA
jgi:peptide/nickel transport system permease protein